MVLYGIIFGYLAQPQNWNIVQREPGVMITDVCFLNDGLNGFAVGAISAGGNLTGLYRTADGGNDWSQMNFPLMNTLAMNSVCFISTDEGWVVGNSGKIYHTSDGGANWTSQSSGITRKLVKVQFINDQEGWITGGWQDGSAYLLLKTTNGGATWQNLSFGTDAYACNSLYFIDSQHGWLSAVTNQITPRIYYTSDGGDTWVNQTIPLSNVGTQVTSVMFADQLKGWAAVSSLYETPSGPILYTADGGTTWSIQYYSNQHYNYLDVRDDQHVAVIGVSILYPSTEKLVVTENGGQSWTSKTVPITQYTQGIHYGESKIWLGANYSIILSTPDLGSNWKWEHYSPLLQSMEWISNDVGYAIAGSNVGTDHWTFKTTDGGVTWETDSVAPGGAEVTFTDPGHGWMLWEGNTAKIWRTVDGGTNWNQYYIPSSGNWIGGICFPTAETGWAYGSNGTLKNTVNGGMTWTSQNGGSSDYFEKVFSFDGIEAWAGGGYGGGNGFIVHTTDAGSTWDFQNYPSSDHVNDFYFLDNQRGWACTTGGNVFITTDGGQTWNQGGNVPEMAIKIVMADALHGWMLGYSAGSAQQGMIYKTTDGGYGWEEEWSGDWPQANLSDLSLQPGNYLWTCGNHSSLMLYDQPVSILKDPGIPNNSLLTASPNPVGEVSAIRYSLNQNQSVTLTLHDLSGRELALLFRAHQSAGVHTYFWDPSSGRIERGIYMIVLNSEEGRRCMKVVVR